MANNQLSRAVSQLNWRLAPNLFQGQGAKPLLEIYQSQTQGNGYLNRFVYDEATQTAKGSSPIMNSRLDSILQPLGLGIATLSELYNPQIRAMLDGKFYSDPAVFVLRGAENKGNSRNTNFIKQLAELVEEANGNLVFPLLITGFNFKPASDKEGYGLQIQKRADFKAISSDRFKGENHGKKFNQVDELGPVFTKDGKFIFYANDNSTLSRLGVDSGGDLVSYDGVVSSGEFGRVVVVSREASVQILGASFEELQKIRDKDIQKVSLAFQEAEKVYRSALAKK